MKAAVPGLNTPLCLPRGLCGALGQHRRPWKGLCPSAPRADLSADKSLAKKSHTFWGYSSVHNHPGCCLIKTVCYLPRGLGQEKSRQPLCSCEGSEGDAHSSGARSTPGTALLSLKPSPGCWDSTNLGFGGSRGQGSSCSCGHVSF